MRRTIVWLAALCCSVVFAKPQSNGEVNYKIKGQGRATFESTAEARQFAAAASAELVKLAAEKYGITLDGSEGSIVQLQRLAETVYRDLPEVRVTSEPDESRQKWIDLFAGYYGEVLVAHHGASWGKTDWLGSDDRALGFPRTRGILLPRFQMQKTLTYPTDLCTWYLIAVSEDDDKPIIPEIQACSEQGWVKSPAELEAEAVRAAERKAFADREAQARLTSRTSLEAQQMLSRTMYEAPALFRKYNVKAPARVVVGFTVAPSGEVTEAHVMSSDASDKRVEVDILAKLRAMRFEARDVPVYVAPGFAVVYTTD